MNEHVMLVGPTAASKTSLLRYLAFLTGNDFMRVSLDGQTDTAELIGEYVPVESFGRRKYGWADGILVEAMKKGYWILLDEMNLADPQVLERINSLIDDDSFLVITEHEGETVRPHPDFRLFAAMNPSRYAGATNCRWLCATSSRSSGSTVNSRPANLNGSLNTILLPGMQIRCRLFQVPWTAVNRTTTRSRSAAACRGKRGR
jgi:hypothetical protein